MSFRKIPALFALLTILGANAAHAGIEVLTVVDNQTSSAVSLGISSTYGTFIYGPVSSVAASTRIGAAGTWTFGSYESGYVAYGPCTMFWDVNLGYYTVYSDAEAFGSGCTATVLAEISTGPHSALVIVELTIN